MNRTITSILLVAALLALVPAAPAQTAVTSTTLSSAVTDTSSRTIVVASASGITVGSTALFIGHEVLFVNAASGTILTVQRGYGGTRPQTHASGATVYIGPSSGTNIFIQYAKHGTCTATNELYLPQFIVNIREPWHGSIMDCFGSVWQYNLNLSLYSFTLAPNAQRSALTPTAGANTALTAQGGGAQSATTSNGAAGGTLALAGGAGGAGGSSSGTGGAGGAVSLIGGAGAGTITGGAGGLASLGGGVGANGTSAGGTGGGINIYSGAAGTGGTGTNGAVNIRQGGAAGTAVFSTSTAGATTVQSTGTNQTLTLNGSGSGKVTLADGTDPTKQLIVNPSGATTATATTLVASQTGNVSITLPNLTGGLAPVVDCGAQSGGTSTCSGTATGKTGIVYIGKSTLASNAQVVTFSTTYTSTATYSCVANDVTTRANPVQMVQTSASTATITNTTGASDVIQWICVGY